MARRYDSRTTTFSPEGRLYQVEYAMESVSHAGCVIGILAPGEAGTELGKELSTAAKKEDSSAVIGGAASSSGTTAIAGSSIEAPLEASVPQPSTSTQASGPTAEDVAMSDTIGAGGSSTDAQASTSTSSSATDKPKGKKRQGVVLAAEKKVTSKLLDKAGGGPDEKIFVVNDNIISAVAGYTADASSLVNYCRNAAQTHLLTYNEAMPVEQLVRRVCDFKQGYTQFGGLRPFGVSFLFAGHDPIHQFQLYASDPSGNYSGWRAHCIGSNNSTASSLLRQDYKDDIGLDEALELAVKVLSKTMDSTTLDHEKVEIATITFSEEMQEPIGHILTHRELDALLEKCGVLTKKQDSEPSGQ